MQQNEQSFIVLDVQGYVNALIFVVDLFNKSGNYEVRKIEEQTSRINGAVSRVESEVSVTMEPLPRLDTTRAMQIVQALADETLSQLTMYRVHANPVPMIAQALRDCINPTDDDVILAENFLCNDTVDGVVLELARQVGQHVAGNPWRQWQMLAAPRMMAMVGGKDFRVAEWEKQHGNEYGDGDEFLRVNITSTVNFIQYSIAHGLNIPLDHIPIHALVLDGLRRHCPDFVFKNNYTLYPRMLSSMGVTDYESFYQAFIREPIESFVMMFLHHNLERDHWLERGERYNAEFTETYQLVVTRRSQTVGLEERRYRDLRQSVDAGDWLPDREIRWMEEYERIR